MNDLKYVRAYIDGVTILSSDTLGYYLTKVDIVLTQLEEAVLNANNNSLTSFIGIPEMQYLRYLLTHAKKESSHPKECRRGTTKSQY